MATSRLLARLGLLDNRQRRAAHCSGRSTAESPAALRSTEPAPMGTTIVATGAPRRASTHPAAGGLRGGEPVPRQARRPGGWHGKADEQARTGEGRQLPIVHALSIRRRDVECRPRGRRSRRTSYRGRIRGYQAFHHRFGSGADRSHLRGALRRGQGYRGGRRQGRRDLEDRQAATPRSTCWAKRSSGARTSRRPSPSISR